MEACSLHPTSTTPSRDYADVRNMLVEIPKISSRVMLSNESRFSVTSDSGHQLLWRERGMNYTQKCLETFNMWIKALSTADLEEKNDQEVLAFPVLDREHLASLVLGSSSRHACHVIRYLNHRATGALGHEMKNTGVAKRNTEKKQKAIVWEL
ncbi:hypothetical protein TNCV_986141 [Trichonephila clavipes]|uniref:Uncharacterized protein n=1 Tax=Trichonephila clavipes TaxID=2585209 RepID=A0A8X6SRD7_TRICX|nr:hypothetical protein TNCV_986141 [Trichonephila clavipes]